MTMGALLAVSLLAAGALASPPLGRVAETWLNDHYWSQEPIHLFHVREQGVLICAEGRHAFQDEDDRYLIDARRHVAWLDSVGAPRAGAGAVTRMDREHLAAWTRCEATGVAEDAVRRVNRDARSAGT